MYYKETLEHYESRNATQYLKDFRMIDEYSMKGWGVNLKLGAIYRPIPEMRIGAAIHTPTWYTMESSSYLNMCTSFYTSPSDDGKTLFSSESSGVFDFDVVSPFRFISSFAYVVQNRGIISLDCEFVDYSLIRMKTRNNKQYADGINHTVKDMCYATSNVRIGGEYKLSSTASFRMGYACLGNPIDEEMRVNDYGHENILSAGLGFRGEYSFLDFAYQYAWYEADQKMYDTKAGTALAHENVNIGKFVMTLGLRF